VASTEHGSGQTVKQARIRNFCIIAHVDHGKSTLSDRLLEHTGTIAARDMSAQVLDQMDLEREKGITIKAKAVRLMYQARDGGTFELNLIDTPGHVDFSYEVSRALAACEGAVLVVDASQGIEAQTLAHLYLALEHHLTIIPVINKIDLPSAQPEQVAKEIEDLFGLSRDLMILTSAKLGVGTEEVLEAIVDRVLPPAGSADWPTRALIFDSHYDPYKGVVAYIRVVDGAVEQAQPLMLMSNAIQVEALEVGYFRPAMTPATKLATGEVGYVATGLKSLKDCTVGDTLTSLAAPAPQPLAGYQPAKPMVFAGLFPAQAEDYRPLANALEKLHLNDAALSFHPETSTALGLGFRCGFLGLLHMEIVRERLEREYALEVVATAPSVAYEVVQADGSLIEVLNPETLPPAHVVREIREPWMEIEIFSPAEHLGSIMDLIVQKRGEFTRLEYPDERRVHLRCSMPLSELVLDFHDQLKSHSRGYASLDYAFGGYRAGALVKLQALVNHQPVDALSCIVHRDTAEVRGQALVARLRDAIPRQMFDVSIQASAGSRVVARADVRALRKDVLEKLSGGDVTRKKKLLQRQLAGKRRLKRLGNVEIPHDAFVALLRID
jgi:GTP-binding protein LepA